MKYSRVCLRMLMAAMFVCVSGCKTQQAGVGASTGNYETVARDSLHDTEAAKKHNATGLEALEQGNFDEAQQAFEKALEADVMFGPAHNNLGQVYYAQKLYYKAAWEYQYAIKLMPNQPEPRCNLGLVYEAVGKLDDAVVQYDEAHELEPDNAIFIGNNARTRIKRGDKDEHVKALLSELIMKDTRSEWVAWAEKKLALMSGGQP